METTIRNYGPEHLSKNSWHLKACDAIANDENKKEDTQNIHTHLTWYEVNRNTPQIIQYLREDAPPNVTTNITRGLTLTVI